MLIERPRGAGPLVTQGPRGPEGTTRWGWAGVKRASVQTDRARNRSEGVACRSALEPGLGPGLSSSSGPSTPGRSAAPRSCGHPGVSVQRHPAFLERLRDGPSGDLPTSDVGPAFLCPRRLGQNAPNLEAEQGPRGPSSTHTREARARHAGARTKGREWAGHLGSEQESGHRSEAGVTLSLGCCLCLAPLSGTFPRGDKGGCPEPHTDLNRARGHRPC